MRFTRHLLKSISSRNGLLFLLLFSVTGLSAADFDPFEYSDLYPNEEFILLDYSVEIELLEEEGKVRTRHKREYLTLKDDVTTLNRFLLTFSESQELKVKMARYYTYVEGKKKLVKNVKTKWLKPRDHYINGIFYNDIKDLEVSTDYLLDRHSYVIIEYEVIDSDLKFMKPIYLSNYGERVLNFNLKLTEPYDALLDLVPYNQTDLNVTSTLSDGVTTISIKDVEPIRSNYNSPPYNYVAPHFVPVVRELAGEKYLASVNDLYKWYNSLIKQVEKSTPEIKSLARAITKNASSEKERIDLIFKFVQKNINYLAFEDGIAGFKPASAIEVIKTGYGDCKGMSNLLVDLLKASEIDAGHAWVGTRRLNYSYDLAALCVDNHMVCWVNFADEIHILDATGKENSWNRIPSFIQGKEALLGKGDDFEIIKLPVVTASENTINLNAEIQIDTSEPLDAISGILTLEGNEGLDSFAALKNVSVSGAYADGTWLVSRYLGDCITDIVVEDITYSNSESNLQLSFTGNVQGAKIKSGGMLKIYPKPLMELLDVSKAETPWYFDNTFSINSSIKYNFKADVTSKSFPTASYSGKDFKLKLDYTSAGKSIIESRSIEVNTIYSDFSEASQRKSFAEAYKSSFAQPIKMTLP